MGRGEGVAVGVAVGVVGVMVAVRVAVRSWVGKGMLIHTTHPLPHLMASP